MSISVGGINLAEAAIDAQYRIGVLEKIVEHMIQRAMPGTINQSDIARYQDQVLAELQNRYPQAGIQKKSR